MAVELSPEQQAALDATIAKAPPTPDEFMAAQEGRFPVEPETETQPPEQAEPEVRTDFRDEYFKLNEKVKGKKVIDPTEYDQLLALKDVIRNTPEALAILEAKLSGRPIPQQPQQAPPQEVQPPTPPQYLDPADMFNPATPTGQYYQQLEDFKAQRIKDSFKSELGTVAQQLNAISQVLMEERRAKAEQSRQEEARERMRSEFLGAVPEGVNDFDAFYQFMGSQQADLPTMYKLFKMQSHQGRPMQRPQNQRPEAPPPSVTKIGSQTEFETDPNIDFMNGIMKNMASRNY